MLLAGAAVAGVAAACGSASIRPTTADGFGGSGPMAYPQVSLSLYLMMWPDGGGASLASIPDQVNVVRLAFAQKDPPTLVGWGPEGRTSFIGAARVLRSQGVLTSLSLGGEGGALNLSNRQGVVDGVMAINRTSTLDGIDIDAEGQDVRLDDVLWIATELRRLRGKDFHITMAPNGSNVDQYLPIAVALNAAGLLTRIGQQFYDVDVSAAQAIDSVQVAIDAGIPAAKYDVGMMLDPAGGKWWTNEQAVANYRAIKHAYPDIGGTYLWEASRPGTAQWAADLGSLL